MTVLHNTAAASHTAETKLLLTVTDVITVLLFQLLRWHLYYQLAAVTTVIIIVTIIIFHLF